MLGIPEDISTKHRLLFNFTVKDECITLPFKISSMTSLKKMDTDTITTIKLNGIFLWPYVQVSLQWQLWIVDQCGFNPSAVDSILQLWIVDHFNPITGDNAHKVKPSGLLSHTHKLTPTTGDRAKNFILRRLTSCWCFIQIKERQTKTKYNKSFLRIDCQLFSIS